LRAGVDSTAQKGSAYAVHAALGLSVAESLLLGCEPVVVEGPSDQHYLTAIKNLLIAAGRLKLGRELVFPPAGGAKGVKAVASILSYVDATSCSLSRCSMATPQAGRWRSNSAIAYTRATRTSCSMSRRSPASRSPRSRTCCLRLPSPASWTAGSAARRCRSPTRYRRGTRSC